MQCFVVSRADYSIYNSGTDVIKDKQLVPKDVWFIEKSDLSNEYELQTKFIKMSYQPNSRLANPQDTYV